MKRLILAENYNKDFVKECEEYDVPISNDIQTFLDDIADECFNNLKQELKDKVTDEIKNSEFESQDKFVTEFIDNFKNKNKYYQKLVDIANGDYSDCEPMFDLVVQIGEDFSVDKETAKSYFKHRYNDKIFDIINGIAVEIIDMVIEEVNEEYFKIKKEEE